MGASSMEPLRLDDINVPPLRVVPLAMFTNLVATRRVPAGIVVEILRACHTSGICRGPCPAAHRRLRRTRQNVLAHDADIRRAVLHVDGHVTGLYQEVADAGLRVLHHQLPGVVVIFRAAVAHACQQIVYLVAEAARLGSATFSITFPPSSSAGTSGQRVQLVQIQREADGPRSRGGTVPPEDR